MRRALIALAAGLALAGCANFKPSVPADYTGPTASIRDSFKAYSDRKADLFYVEAVDGHEVLNSRIRTQQVNSGRGMYMDPQALQHTVAARPVTVAIVARTQYAAPILALTSTVYQIKGTVEFRPEAGKTYVVRGDLSEARSSVWIEEAGGGTVMGRKTEREGSTALGTLEK